MTEVTVVDTIEVVAVTVIVSLVDTIEVVEVTVVFGAMEVEDMVDTVRQQIQVTSQYCTWENFGGLANSANGIQFTKYFPCQ